MDWYDISNPEDTLLDELAARYKLHSLHIEDCRHRNQSAKIEFLDSYVFAVLKPVEIVDECTVQPTDLDVFIGPDYVITVQETTCAHLSEMLGRVHALEQRLTPSEVFYRVFDGVVDLYHPVTDTLSERISTFEEEALTAPKVSTIEELFALRRALIELRRILANSRDVAGHLLRTDHALLNHNLQPFFRDIYDHVARNLDIVEVQRDLVTGATELYLSAVANQTNQVMKVLTIFGTVATPALVITGIYGMNLQHLPLSDHPHSWAIVLSIIGLVSGLMLFILRRMRWI